MWGNQTQTVDDWNIGGYFICDKRAYDIFSHDIFLKHSFTKAHTIRVTSTFPLDVLH